MKSNFKKLIILFLCLLIVSTIVIFTMGRTITVKVGINNIGTYNVKIDNSLGDIEILENEKKGNDLILKVKGKKPGVVIIDVIGDKYQTGVVLYIHKSMVITDNTYFGYSTGSEIIPISLSVFLIVTLVLLIQRYRYFIKQNLYQYKNIAYLGIIIFLSILTLSTIFSLINYQGLYETINNLINSMSFVSFILFPLALVTFILVTISNIQLIIKEGRSLRNFLGLFLGIFLCVSTLLPDFVYGILLKSQKINIYNLNSIGPYLYDFLESLVYLSISYLECVLAGTVVIALKAIHKKIKHNKDYMIILGCAINDDGTLPPLLRGRVDKAIDFRNRQLKSANKDLIFIPSGGKGNDECISESEAMTNYLIEKGISKKNIIMENKSANTYENIKFSNKLIKKKDANVAFSTTNYHVLRAGLLATEQGLKYEGIGSKTKMYFMINAFIREFIGTLYAEKKKHIMVFSLIVVLLIIMLSITYISNNI